MRLSDVHRLVVLLLLAASALSARRATAQALAPLEVDGFRDAVAFVPGLVPNDGARKHPVIVALHGNYDRPEWQCEVWRGIVGEGAFIVCPRGVPRSDAPASEDRWTWKGLAATEREVEAAVAALEARYPERARNGQRVLVGFSLGGTMAARLATRRPEVYSRLVLVEGGSDVWTLAVARRFLKGGGVRVLAACGQSACFPRFRHLDWAFKTAGLPLRVVGSRSAGHTYAGEVASAIAENWRWLVEDDPAFIQ
jgi:pimeloyl-ACP methyl ester carboxylesterase